MNHGGFPMHHPVILQDFASKNMADALVAEANTKKRNGGTERLDDFIRDACLLRRAGTWGNDNALGGKFFNFLDGDLVVALHEHLAPHLAKVLHEIIGEAVVVIDDQKHERPKYMSWQPSSNQAKGSENGCVIDEKKKEQEWFTPAPFRKVSN